MSIPSAVDPAITFADQVLREDGDASTWPSSREARWALRDARNTLQAALGEYQAVLQDTSSWSTEEEDAALDEASKKAFDAALALGNRLHEYRQREAAAGSAWQVAS